MSRIHAWWADSSREHRGDRLHFHSLSTGGGAKPADQIGGRHVDWPSRGWNIARFEVPVTEDSYVNRIFMVDLLELGGCEVIQAVDGAEAVELARAETPDLIVLDIQLPVMDGVMVAGILRSDPTTAHLPILAATAQAMPDEVDRIRAAGVDGYLAKPFTQDQFLASVAGLVKERALV